MEQNVNHSPQLQLFMMHATSRFCVESLETVYYPKGPDFNSPFVIERPNHDQTVCIKNYIAP